MCQEILELSLSVIKIEFADGESRDNSLLSFCV